jgi:gamma-polyglutamate synthase
VLFLYVVLGLGMLILFVAGVVEQRRHFANLQAIPVRILVNGIRGKSSITRLCAGALTGGSLHVAAKTTGTAARYISPDGSEVPVYRKFNIPNPIEQIGVVKHAAAEHVDALVVECMAVEPSLQQLNQDKLIRSTIGVISNVREDHLTEMGPTLERVARSLARTLPRGGVCVTAESAWFPVLEEEARRRKCRLLFADAASVADEEMEGFGHFAFKENVAIALEVARAVGVGRIDALRGMWGAQADPSVLTVETYTVGGKSLRFANIFSANDPRSTRLNLDRLLESALVQQPIFTLINCRPDRIERNRQMAELVPELGTERVFVIGHPAKSAIRALPRGWQGKVVDLGGEGRDPEEIFGSILQEVEHEASLLAIGNVHGQGERLLEFLEGLGGLR